MQQAPVAWLKANKRNSIPKMGYTESNLIHACGMLTIMCIAFAKIIAQHCMCSFYSSFSLFNIHLRFLWSSLCNFQLNFNATRLFLPHHFGKSCISFWIMTEHKKYDIKIARRIPLLGTRMHVHRTLYGNIHALSFILTFINVLTTVFVTTTTNSYN